MIITTTPTIEGHPIEEYLGIVTGEAILGAHIRSDREFAQGIMVGDTPTPPTCCAGLTGCRN